MKFTNKTDIFFDLDHTLWDFEKNSALAFDAIFKKHAMAISLENFLEYYIPVNFKYWKLYQEEKITQQELRYSRFKEVFDLLDYPIDDEQINFLAQEYIHYLPTFNHLFEGAIEILDYLKSKYNLHIITNGFHEVQEGKLRNANIAHYFITVTNSEKAGVKKPNPIIFEYALDIAKAEKDKSIMIGDSMEADIQGALNVGLDAIFFSESDYGDALKVPQIRHLLELKKIL
ncbi:YjjG family noncanonical pyrimidine nucleotidase [Flavobacterium cerinum]|uniref:YjjG family noncanonical pyrimidine nucleotidase n=1 Tax=Flavobacterium cerinum TaxID=2502784 RepID=A0ABY5IYY5_9FLAO|nr:YjjG family noncanonical pyrimidine nucleotidase [Flavobacterium cerinum]UUC46953.1 YjjG family noncanonical pyrimidine nucleotidase [Flavobacterium cerinum]